jgi:hypothetical protein
MLDQRTISWTPGPLSGAFFIFRITISGESTISGGLDMAPALPQLADAPRVDTRS